MLKLDLNRENELGTRSRILQTFLKAGPESDRSCDYTFLPGLPQMPYNEEGTAEGHWGWRMPDLRSQGRQGRF